MKILSALQMQEVDRLTTEKLGVPSLVLMENAGRNVYRLIAEKFPSLETGRVLVLCGKGNNGGDGFVVARYLHLAGKRPRVVLLAPPEALQGDARQTYEMLRRAGCEPLIARDPDEWRAASSALAGCTLLVDGILGTGLRGPVEGFYLDIIRDVNRSFSRHRTVAVDLPSGVPSDPGVALGESLAARYSVTFTAPKWGHIFPPNCERVGELFVTPIGTPASLYEDDPAIFLNLVDGEALAWAATKRRADSHKGTYGHALIVAGSRGKSGAAGLAGLGALRAGAGLVTVATAASVWQAVAAASPALMTEPLPETDQGTISGLDSDPGRVEAVCRGKSVVAIGPGLSTNPATVFFVRHVVRDCLDLPIVIDADGLNAFAGAADLLNGEGRTLILTPHPGEMARLTGLSTREVQASRAEVAREFAMRQKVYVVLKGYRTLIAEPGGQVYVNPTGNAGMATAGTGDVLSGMIAGLLAQHLREPVEKVVSAAVYWHGAAGDIAAQTKGELPLIATDILEAMPQALRAAAADGQGNAC